MQPRLKDIAERAGVSVQAVSAVLSPTRSTSNVGDATRRRVMRIADELGYVRNAVASSLVRGSSATIGLTCFNLRDRHFLIAIDAAEKQCAEHDHVLLVSTPREAPDWSARLRDGRVDFLLVIATGLLESIGQHIPPALQQRVAVVGGLSRSHHPQRQWGTQISWDDYKGGALAAEYLVRQGCRRVAVFSGVNVHSPKIDAAARVFAEADVEHHLIDADDESDMVMAGVAMAERLIDQHGDGFDSILLRNDQFYPGVIEVLTRRQPERAAAVEIVGYGGFYSCITSVRTPIRDAIDYALGSYFNGGPTMIKDRQFDVVLQPKARAAAEVG